MCGGYKKGENPSSFGKNSLTEKQWITDLPAGLRGRVILGKGKKMDKTDSAIHELFRAVKEKDIKWNDFPSIGLSESYYRWYYAENRLYIIMDVMTNGIYFIEARSPIEAFGFGILASRLDEAMRAGQMVDEEYDESF